MYEYLSEELVLYANSYPSASGTFFQLNVMLSVVEDTAFSITLSGALTTGAGGSGCSCFFGGPGMKSIDSTLIVSYIFIAEYAIC